MRCSQLNWELRVSMVWGGHSVSSWVNFLVKKWDKWWNFSHWKCNLLIHQLIRYIFFSSLSSLEKEAKYNEISLHDGIIPISNFQEIVWVLYTFSPIVYLIKNNTTPFYRWGNQGLKRIIHHPKSHCLYVAANESRTHILWLIEFSILISIYSLPSSCDPQHRGWYL